MSKKDDLTTWDNDTKVKTPEEVAAQDALNSSVKINFGSKADSEVEGGFLPLAEGLYLVTVSKVEARNSTKYQSDEEEVQLMVEFDINECLSDKDVKDTTGVVQTNGTRKFWEWLSTTSVGFRIGGAPSKTRACICALQGVSVEEAFTIDNVNDLVGKQCKVYLELATKKDGSKKNKSVKYSSV